MKNPIKNKNCTKLLSRVIRKGGIVSNIEVLNYEKTNVLNKDRITRGLTNIRKIISNPCYGQLGTINPDYGRLVIVCPDDGYKINASSANVHLIIECPNYKCIVNNSSVYGDSDTYNPKRGQAENLDKNSGKQGQNYQKKSINSYLTASNDNVKGNSYSTRDKIKNNTQGAKTGVHDTSQRNSQAWQDSESISNHSDSHEETQRQEDSLPKHLKLKGHSKLQMGSKWNLACWNVCGNWNIAKKIISDRIDAGLVDLVVATETHTSTTPGDSAAGVIFVMSEIWKQNLKYQSEVNSRINIHEFQANPTDITIIGIYAPCSKNKDKFKKFMVELKKTILAVNQRNMILIMGDFNAKIRRNSEKSGIWNIHMVSDERGVAMEKLSNELDLKLVSSNFTPRRHVRVHQNIWERIKKKRKYMSSYQKSNSINPNAKSQIDHVLCNSRWSSSVINAKTNWMMTILRHGSKQDHAWLQIKVHLKLSNKPARAKALDYGKLITSDEIRETFDRRISQALRELSSQLKKMTIERKWKSLSSIIRKISEDTIPKIPTQKKPLPVQNNVELMKILQERANNFDKSREMKLMYKRKISRVLRKQWRQFVARILKEMEQAQIDGDQRTLHKLAKIIEGKHKVSGKQPAKTLQGEIITSNTQLLYQWKKFLKEKYSLKQDTESYEHSYNQPTNLDEKNGEVAEQLILTETDFQMALKTMRNAAAMGPDKIHIACVKASVVLQKVLRNLFNEIISENIIPEEWTTGDIIMLYKRKCSNNYKNYRPICLLPHVLKLLTKALLLKTKNLVDMKLDNFQFAYRSHLSTNNAILIVQKAALSLVRSRKPSIMASLDWNSAFDSVTHQGLLNNLNYFKPHNRTCSIIQKIYSQAKCKVKYKGQRSTPFRIESGLLQGESFSPFLFIMTTSKIMEETNDEITKQGIVKVKLTKNYETNLINFSDDTFAVTYNIEDMSKLIRILEKVGGKYGLTLNPDKIQIMGLKPLDKQIAITESQCDESFKYLCPECKRTFPSKQGVNVHIQRWCTGNKEDRPRKSQKANLLINEIRREKDAAREVLLMYKDTPIRGQLNIKYLGIYIDRFNRNSKMTEYRIKEATLQLKNARNYLRKKGGLSERLLWKLFYVRTLPILLYSSECWILNKETVRALRYFAAQATSIIMGTVKHMTYSLEEYPQIIRSIQLRKWKMFGHACRHRIIPEQDLTVELLKYDPLFKDVENIVSLAQKRKLWQDLFDCIYDWNKGQIIAPLKEDYKEIITWVSSHVENP